MTRTARVQRTTKESDVLVALALDGLVGPFARRDAAGRESGRELLRGCKCRDKQGNQQNAYGNIDIASKLAA